MEGADSAHPFCLKLHKGDKKEHTYYISTDKEENLTRYSTLILNLFSFITLQNLFVFVLFA